MKESVKLMEWIRNNPIQKVYLSGPMKKTIINGRQDNTKFIAFVHVADSCANPEGGQGSRPPCKITKI